MCRQDTCRDKPFLALSTNSSGSLPASHNPFTGHLRPLESTDYIMKLLFYFIFWFFETGFLSVALAVSVNQAGLELRNPPASASQVLGLKVDATTLNCL